jgi:hypothetical protein
MELRRTCQELNHFLVDYPVRFLELVWTGRFMVDCCASD